jgi:hypothetical protein
MSIEVAMLLSAGIAAVVSLLTLLITRIFDTCSEKRKERERFFYEVFPKRLELYEEIIRAIDFVSNTEEALLADSPLKLSAYYKEKCDALADLGFQCAVFGSARIVRTIALLEDAVAEFTKLILSLCNQHDGDAYRSLVNSFTPSAVSIKLKLIEFIREESGVYMIDKKTNDFLRNVKKSKKLQKDEGNNN